VSVFTITIHWCSKLLCENVNLLLHKFCLARTFRFVSLLLLLLWACRLSQCAADSRRQCSATQAGAHTQELPELAPVLFIALPMCPRSPASLMSWLMSQLPSTTTSNPLCNPKGTSWIMTGGLPVTYKGPALGPPLQDYVFRVPCLIGMV